MTEPDTNGHQPQLRPLADAEPALARGVDLEAAERAAGDLLEALGIDLCRLSLRETPPRIARLYRELLTPAAFTPTSFPNGSRVGG